MERLEQLDLSHNRLRYRDLESLTRMFMRCRWRRMPSLRSLCLSQCTITNEMMTKLIAPCLATEQVLGGLQELWLDNNCLDGRALSALQAHAGGMRALKHLWLSDNLFSYARVEDFALWLKRDAKWESIFDVHVVPERSVHQYAEKEAWNQAKKLVDLAVRAHELEREWRTALPQRLG